MSQIQPAIVCISGSFMPRVVTAGVPMRMPLVTTALPVSNGMAFLLTVMPASSSACVGVLAGEALVAEVDQHQVVVGAAGDDAETALRQHARPWPARW